MSATPAASPLLKAAIYTSFAFRIPVSASCAAAQAVDVEKAIIKAAPAINAIFCKVFLPICFL